MATWHITQTGQAEWFLWGGNITNHEAFAIAPDNTVPANVGITLGGIAVFNNVTSLNNNQTTYLVAVSPVDTGFDPLASQFISATINSNQV
jgi:hypothetical protein